MIHHSQERGPKADHVLVRLADEGIPAAALARAFKRPLADILEVLKDALENGELIELPASDWPPGTRRENRLPTVSPVRVKDAEDLAVPIQRVFGMTKAESRFLAALLHRREMSKPSLHVALSGDDPITDAKIVDVYACHVRRKLLPYQIRIETIWGRGYALTRENADAVLARLADFNRQEMAA